MDEFLLSSGEETEASDNDIDESEDNDNEVGTKKLRRSPKKGTINQANAKRFERKRQRRAAKADPTHLAERRRKKGIKLNKLSSNSGVGVTGVKAESGKGERECYTCGEKGHGARGCPSRGRWKNEDIRTQAVKRSRSSLTH